MLKLLLVLVTACSFSPGANVPPSGGADDDDDGSADPPTGSNQPQPELCHVTNPDGLLLCLDFEDPGLTVVTDSSIAPHNVRADGLDVTYRDNQQAAKLKSNSANDTPIIVDESDLNLTDNYTVEMWLEYAGEGPYTWSVDNPDLFGLGINSNGKPFCYGGDGQWADGPDPLDGAVFTHVACVHTMGELRLYVGAERVACAHVQAPLQHQNDAMIFGAAMEGGIDDIHIYARPLAEDEIARNAAKPAHADLPCPNS